MGHIRAGPPALFHRPKPDRGACTMHRRSTARPSSRSNAEGLDIIHLLCQPEGQGGAAEGTLRSERGQGPMNARYRWNDHRKPRDREEGRGGASWRAACGVSLPARERPDV